MEPSTIETASARAEDTALLGSNRSAVPGAKTEGRAADLNVRRPSFPTPFGIGIIEFRKSNVRKTPIYGV